MHRATGRRGARLEHLEGRARTKQPLGLDGRPGADQKRRVFKLVADTLKRAKTRIEWYETGPFEEGEGPVNLSRAQRPAA